MLIGTGCGVPGIMAARTIENERDRRMTIMTTTFIPCGAKLPIIALIASALFGGAWWVAPSAYFIGIAAIIISGIMLKKTKMFAGDPAPFVMELPAYHWPTVGNVLRSMWERAWSFIKKAGTIILLSSIIIWAGLDDAGIKFNQSKAWDGNETGFSGINSINGDLAGNIKDNGDNIATDTPGWYLMVITSSVSGRNLVYDIQFNKPEIWLMGPVVGNSDWKEQAEGWLCTIPDTFNASFVSPAFAASVPGGDGDGVRGLPFANRPKTPRKPKNAVPNPASGARLSGW